MSELPASPDAGHILLNGEPTVFHSPKDAIAHGVGMVYQHYRLVASQTVAENLLLGLPGVPFRLNAGTFIQQARELGQRYQLQIDPGRPVWQLSVGEQQRVEILKTLQRGARILILDEPTAVLTPQESEDLMRTLRRIAAEGRVAPVVAARVVVVELVTDERDGRTLTVCSEHHLKQHFTLDTQFSGLIGIDRLGLVQNFYLCGQCGGVIDGALRSASDLLGREARGLNPLSVPSPIALPRLRNAVSKSGTCNCALHSVCPTSAITGSGTFRHVE